jgi:H+/Cl- antiporter ClcA
VEKGSGEERRSLQASLARGFTRTLTWIATRLLPRRFRQLTMLVLPYQVAAVITAFIAVGYALLFGFVERFHHWMLGLHPDWIFISAPVCFLVSWWLVRRFSPFAGGSGIPQLMAAIEVADEKENDRSWRFLNVRIIIVKILSSLAMVAGGGAVGREGPTLQISGSVFRVIHRLLPPFWPKISRRIMLITGGAAGLSAAFNTPLGGIVFAIEELTKTHIAQFRTAVFAAVIIAGMTAQWLIGPYLGPYLGYPLLEPVGFSFMYKVLIIGFSAGLAGALFCKVVLAVDRFRRTLNTLVKQAAWALGCAFAFALMVHWLGPVTLGSGKHLLQSYLFDPVVDASPKNIIARIVGPLFTFSAGGAGGIFAPSLSSGAAVGGFFASMFDPSRGAFNVLVLCGMAAFLTGVSRSPFTSAILVLEMTDRHSVIFQLMYATMVAYLIAQAVDHKSYYERMKQRLLNALPGRKEDRSRRPEGTPDPGMGLG